MVSKIIIGTIGILLAIGFFGLSVWQFKKLQKIDRDVDSSIFPKFRNYLDLYLLLISIMFIAGSITIFII
ncbi:MAG: hypothetical protein HRT98_02520 [Mycoplasmatales bacterium]|nr:hypothetical protein [Mycoplasmatales bacterium]